MHDMYRMPTCPCRSQPQALHGQALLVGKKRITQDHWSHDERMGGRHAAPQAHSTNVMCHVPAGTPTVPYARGGRPGRPSAHGVPGVADSPHGETNPGWRATCPSPNRAGTPEAERCYRVNGATPCAVHRGATSPVHRGRRWPTRPGTHRRRPLLSHRVHRGTPRPHSRYHQAPGSGSGPLGRKWRKPRQGPCRSPWWRPPHGQEPDDGNCTGRGLLLRRQAPFEADGDSSGPGHVRGPRAATPKARDGDPLREGHQP